VKALEIIRKGMLVYLTAWAFFELAVLVVHLF